LENKERKDQRVGVLFSVKIKDPKTGKVMSCKALNLSASGMMVRGRLPLFIGTEIEAVFRPTPNDPKLEVHGTVRWVSPSDNGTDGPMFIAVIRFEKLSGLRSKLFQRIVMELTIDLTQTLRDLPAFSRLNQLDLLALASVAHRRTLTAGTILAKQGDEAKSLFVVEEGLVKLCGPGSLEGFSSVEVAGTGQIFGEVSALVGLPHDLEITSLESTKLISIPKDGLNWLRQHHPESALRLMDTLFRATGMKLRRVTRKLLQVEK
jgi:CRP-like cAMP-binding protein